jgi:hypothetical protein
MRIGAANGRMGSNEGSLAHMTGVGCLGGLVNEGESRNESDETE